MLTPRNEALAFRIWATRRQLPELTVAELAFSLSTTPARIREVARAKGWHIEEEQRPSGAWCGPRRISKFHGLQYRPHLGELA